MGYPVARQPGSPDWKFHRVMWSRGMVFAKENGAGQPDTKRKGAKEMVSKRPSLRGLSIRGIWLRRIWGKLMAPHSSTLAWKIPWMMEPGRLQFMGSLWVGHNWATSLSLFTFMHWRRKWQPTPVFLPGESQGWGSLVGSRLWGHTVWHNWSDTAAAVYFFSSFIVFFSSRTSIWCFLIFSVSLLKLSLCLSFLLPSLVCLWLLLLTVW